jgi:hypothetical protein
MRRGAPPGDDRAMSTNATLALVVSVLVLGATTIMVVAIKATVEIVRVRSEGRVPARQGKGPL